MKQFLCILCALCLCLFSVTCAWAEESTETVTLQEKMQRQIALGSGLRGVMKMQMEGEEGLPALLSPLEDTEFQFSYINAGERFDLELTAEKNEKNAGNTVVFSDGNTAYMTSDWLMDTVLSMPVGEELTAMLEGRSSHVQPEIMSALLGLLCKVSSEQSALAQAAEALTAKARQRLDAYAGDIQLAQENGQTRMVFQYVLSPDEMKTEMKLLMRDLLADQKLLDLLRMELSEEQAAAYLNPNYLWYYERIIDGIKLDDDVVYERVVTMQGEEVATSIALALPEDAQFRELVWERENGVTTLTVSDATRRMVLSAEESTEQENGWQGRGTLAVALAEDREERMLWTCELKRYQHVDAESVHYEGGTFALQLEKDAEGESPEYVPLQLNLTWQFSSKAAKRAATDLEVRLDVKLPEGQIVAALAARTQSPWELPERTATPTSNLADMTAEERVQVMSDFLINGLIQLSSLDGDTAASETAVATQTDLEEAN